METPFPLLYFKVGYSKIYHNTDLPLSTTPAFYSLLFNNQLFIALHLSVLIFTSHIPTPEFIVFQPQLRRSNAAFPHQVFFLKQSFDSKVFAPYTLKAFFPTQAQYF